MIELHMHMQDILKYLQNCNEVASASLDNFSSDTPGGSPLPPNMVTFVTPLTRQKAVIE